MKRGLGKITAAAFLVLVLATRVQAQLPTFTVLHSFTASPDGVDPVGGLLRDAATGDLYGTTFGGGLIILPGGTSFGGNGTVFELNPAGNETILARFTLGSGPSEPFAGVVRDAAGNLYGTTRDGPDGGALNFGTVFKLDTSGNVTVLHSFNCFDGAAPFAPLFIDASGNLYGTAGSGCGNSGTVFKIDSAGNFAVLHTFMGPDGAGPVAGVIMDAAGNLYGTTTGGGTGACPFGSFVEPCGTVFKLDPSGNETVLYSFTGGSDGLSPQASLIIDSGGNLYGTTLAGGFANATCTSETAAIGCGTVFKLDRSGNETVLYSFRAGRDGALPTGSLAMDGVGNLYGTTSEGGPGPCTGRGQVQVGCGTVFKLDPAGNETVLYSFTGGNDGAIPAAGLVKDAAGNLYGTARSGGFGTTAAGGPCAVVSALGGCGTVFKLTIQTPAPTITSISPTSAIAGGAGFPLTVNGTNFVGGSAVNFNGNARVTTLISATELTGAILASDIATAGTFNVTVTNPGGGTSNALSFTVVTPEDTTGAIINSVNVLFSQGVINGGQHNSLVVQLQHAISMMNAGKNAGAIENLDSFISEVNDLLSSGVLSPSQAASLVSPGESVLAAL